MARAEPTCFHCAHKTISPQKDVAFRGSSDPQEAYASDSDVVFFFFFWGGVKLYTQGFLCFFVFKLHGV